jgi:dTDP-4-dehydrorhamnose reductase
MKILVLGCKGQLGRCLNDQLIKTDHEVICTSREQIDIADFEATKSKILEFSPDLIINATAYTAVDKAEDDQETANLINHLAVKNIADFCSQKGYWLIHFSTDFVFDGNSEIPYKEDDPANPLSIYGGSKLKGEHAIKSSGCKYLIIRTAWVYSEYGSNFLKTILRLGADLNKLGIVGDQIGCPTYAQDIAKSIVSILSVIDLKGSSSGIYHYCGHESCSWYDFACAIFLEAGAHGFKTPRNIRPIFTADYPTVAKRPAYSVLDCKKINRCFGVTRLDLRDGIKKVLDRLQD